MRNTSSTSKPNSLLCPLCEISDLHPTSHDSMRCKWCGGHLNGSMLKTLRQISTLPDALGKHACECGHSEMRLLPDGTYHCPACGSEILPINAEATTSKPDEHSAAYLAGWMDGRLGSSGSFVDNPNLAQWESPSDRLDYYKGHRAGREARQTSNSRNLGSHERLIG